MLQQNNMFWWLYSFPHTSLNSQCTECPDVRHKCCRDDEEITYDNSMENKMCIQSMYKFTTLEVSVKKVIIIICMLHANDWCLFLWTVHTSMYTHHIIQGSVDGIVSPTAKGVPLSVQTVEREGPHTVKHTNKLYCN